LRLNPFDPQNFVWYNTLAYAHLFAGQPGSALECSRRAQEVRPDWRPAVESAVCSLVLLGQRGEAHRCVERLSAMPAAAGDALWPLRRNNPDWNSQIEAWLRGAAEAASS
jgi:hypothetical protein